MPNQNEVALLARDITDEVNRDAEVISGQLFGGNAQTREPDLARMPADQLQAVYTRKYLENDRDWLQREARRDPQQFIKVANQIGVVLPDQIPGWAASPATLPQPGVSALAPPPDLAQAAQALPIPLAPAAPPAAVMPLAAALVPPQVPPAVLPQPVAEPILVPPEF